MSNINDMLLKSIDIVVESKLNEMNFDRTITGIIIDDSRASEGEYQISYQNSKFWATSEAKYKNGQKVYVTVTQDGARFIAGSCSSGDTNVYNYTLPENRVVIATDNLVETIPSAAVIVLPESNSSWVVAAQSKESLDKKNFNYGFDTELKYILLKADF